MGVLKVRIESNVNSSNISNQVQNTNLKNAEIKDIEVVETKSNEKIPLEQKKEFEMTIPEKVLIDAIESANKKLVGARKELHISVHQRTKAIMVKVVDTQTNEIIREIPPEKTLDMFVKMLELAGIFVDEKR